ncbi:hypothetical protein D3C76_1025650 [compost metagenome]
MVGQALVPTLDRIGDALGFAGRAGGIGDTQQGVGRHLDVGRTGRHRGELLAVIQHLRCLPVERHDMTQTLDAPHDPQADLAKFRPRYQQARAGVVEDRDLLGQGMPGVERHVDQAGLLCGENAFYRFRRIVEQHGDALPHLQAKGNQGVGETVAARLHLVVSQCRVAEDQRGAAAVLPGCPTEHESCGAFFCHDILSYCRQLDTALGSVVPPVYGYSKWFNAA